MPAEEEATEELVLTETKVDVTGAPATVGDEETILEELYGEPDESGTFTGGEVTS